jgi:predicted HicB family RNase H-like nuclease
MCAEPLNQSRNEFMTKAQIKKLAAQYPKFVEWSEEDGCFVGRCPLLFGGGVHGADEANVYRELCKAAEEWVEILHKDGVPLPKTKRSSEYSGKFMIRVEPALHQRLVLKAVSTGESLNQLIARTLAKA